MEHLAGMEAVSRELVDAALADKEAFAAIVERHESMVYSVAYNFFQDRTLAQDIAQEAYLELYRNLAKLENDAHLSNWLRQTVTRKCIDYKRRRKNRFHRPLEEIREPGRSDALRDPLLAGALGRKIAALPEKMRIVLILRFQEDLKLNEIAEATGIPVNTVKTLLHRSLKKLRAKAARFETEVCYEPLGR